MAQMLKSLEDDIGRRFTLYRRMCDHIGASRTYLSARGSRSDVRTALLSCASCPHAAVCSAWMDAGNEGVPAFCNARSAFERLI